MIKYLENSYKHYDKVSRKQTAINTKKNSSLSRKQTVINTMIRCLENKQL